MQQTKTKGEIKVSTVNELRGDLGDEPVPGGDVILRPANEIPALEDDEVPTDGEPQTDEEKRLHLQKAVDQHGKRRFTDEDIERILKQ